MARRVTSRWERELQRLDPEADAQRIVFIDASLEFPWDTQRSLELAFYRTYAVPSIGELLDSTGEFTERAQKRYDDTQILISRVLRVRLRQRPRAPRDPPDEPDPRRASRSRTRTSSTCSRRWSSSRFAGTRASAGVR